MVAADWLACRPRPGYPFSYMRGRFIELADVKKKDGGVLIAMSGGVDSAVAALLVRQAGLRAVGLTMKNYCYGDAEVPDRSCCSVEAINDARRECDRLGIPHVVADAEELFTREVIDDFLSEYENARTPNPCVRCNSIVRFKTLFDYADRLGIGYVATGHYARVFETDAGTRYLARSSNRDKDQSYFLAGVRDDMLDRVVFPLGDYTKGAVRELAGSASMAVASASWTGSQYSRSPCRTLTSRRKTSSMPGTPMESPQAPIKRRLSSDRCRNSRTKARRLRTGTSPLTETPRCPGRSSATSRSWAGR